MSKYTTQLRWIIDEYNIDKTLPTMDKIAIARPKIFDPVSFDFSGYLPSALNFMLSRNYMKEIGVETAGLWRYYMNMRLVEIGQYYDSLYRLVTTKFDPLVNTKLVKSYDGLKVVDENVDYRRNNYTKATDTSATHTTSNDSAVSDSTEINSDLPQTTLNGKDYATQSSQNTSNANNRSDNTGNANATNETNQNLIDTNKLNNNENTSYTETTTGNNGSKNFAEMIRDAIDSLQNFNKKFADEFDDLFMNIY